MFSNNATQSLVVALNASFTKLITANVLIGIFRKETDWAPWAEHLDLFFGDMPVAMIERFLEENNLTLSHLTEIYVLLPKSCRGKLYRAPGKSNLEDRLPYGNFKA